MYMKKILSHLSKTNNSETENKNKFTNYEIEDTDVLQKKLRQCTPIPFVCTDENICFFTFKKCGFIEFAFNELIDIQLGWFYFNMKLKSIVENPLKKLHHMNTSTKCVL